MLARSSRYSATFHPPSVICFGEWTAITAFRPERSTPSFVALGDVPGEQEVAAILCRPA